MFPHVVVSRASGRSGGWTLTRDGRWAATFRAYEDAIRVARQWAAENNERDPDHAIRVYVERTHSRLDLDREGGFVSIRL